MAWTLNALKAAVLAFHDGEGNDVFTGAFTDAFPTIVRQAEERIFHVAKVAPTRKKVDVTIDTTNVVLDVPDLMAPIFVRYGTSPLLYKQSDWLAEVFGNASGEPVAYAICGVAGDAEQRQIVVAPAPVGPASFTVEYFAKPLSLTDVDPDTGTTWISTNCGNALFQGCLFYAYIYEKGEQDMMAVYQAEFEKSLALLKGFVVGDMRRDDFRSSKQPEG